MKHKSRRKSVRRKYKRLVAALAGAAVVSSALLPGLPISRVYAADNTEVANPAPGATLDDPNTLSGSPAQELNAKPDSDSPPKGRLDAKNFRNRGNRDDRTTDKERYHDRDFIGRDNPVDVVRDNASTFGFDAYNDKFTLLSVTGSKAIVEVRTGGQTFKVDLERSDGTWVITTVRGIGNGVYPATYRPASLYGYRTLSATALSPVVAGQRTLYSNDEYSGWTWQEGAYPGDMQVGVLLYKPADTAGVPGIIIDKAGHVNFDRQIVLYAYIGSVAAKGYGIGIEKVVQTGNDLTVTIRTKSPAANTLLAPTQTNEIIPIDRWSLSFDDPINIRFIDQNGTTLNTYTIGSR